MANKSSCTNNHNDCSSIICTTTPISPWKKLNEPTMQATLAMDSVVDASSWPALSSRGVTSPEVIVAASSSLPDPAPSMCVGSEIGGNNNESYSRVSVSICVSVSVDHPANPMSRELNSSSSSSPDPISKERNSSSSFSPNPLSRGPQTQSLRDYSYGHNQHYSSSDRLGTNHSGNGFNVNQRGTGFNAKVGNKGGDGFPNHNFTKRHQQRGFNNWNHKRGGFNANANANARLVNSQQYSHHGFVKGPSGFIGRPPPLPHAFPHPTPLFNPPYVNVNVNFPPPPSPAPTPGYMLPFGFYGNPYFSEALNPLYCPSVPPVPPLPPVPSPPPYLDAMHGPLSYNRPIFPNPEFELCNRILRQIEYYFSKENLVKDAYFRSLMDDEGWVPVHLIAEFRRVKAMTSDINLIVRALQSSAVVEVQGDMMRRRGDWMNWVRHHSTAARISSITDVSTGIQAIQLTESAGGDAVVGHDFHRLNSQMKESDAS